MQVAEKNRSLNIQHGLELLRSVAGKADVAVMPEVWTTGYALGALSREAEYMDSPLLSELAAAAREGGFSLVAGSVPFRREDGKIYNTTLVFDKTGELVADYDKLHMFSLYNEERFFHPGAKMTRFVLDGTHCGLSICYDLRFPELFRSMAVAGTELVFLPAEWPVARGDDWRLLVQARALESQLFICAVNCVGSFRSETFFGHSLLVDPRGKILAEGGGEEEIIYVDADMAEVAKARRAMSVLQDVRWEIYRA
jgi:predicted amidohydrolase